MASATEPRERFHPTGGRVVGVGTILLALGAVAWGLVSDVFTPPVIAGAAVVAVLAWAALLRPGVDVREDRLVLRNMLETIHVPLGAIEDVAIGQVLAIRAGRKRYVSPAIGRTMRQAMRKNSPHARGPTKFQLGQLDRSGYADYVEDRIRRLAADDRLERGVREGSEEQARLAAGVRREPAWPEIVLLALSLAAFVVTLFL